MKYRLTYIVLLPNGTQREERSEFKTEKAAREAYDVRKGLDKLYANVRLDESR